VAAAASVSAAAASVAAAAAAASDKLEAGSVFPVEDVERRQADVEDFFLTEGEFVTRFDGPRGQICGGAGRLCDYAARQGQKSSGPPRLVRPCSDAFASRLASRATWKGLLRTITRTGNDLSPGVHTKQVSKKSETFIGRRAPGGVKRGFRSMFRHHRQCAASGSGLVRASKNLRL